MEYDLKHTDENNQILYIAAHGGKYDLANGTVEVLKKIPDYGEKIKDILIGSCQVGENIKILKRVCAYSKRKDEYGANWVFSYRCIINWMETMLIDLSILDKILSNENPPIQKNIVLNAFKEALAVFNKNYLIGENQKGKQINIKGAIRLILRPPGPPTIQDGTHELLERLSW